MGISELFQYGAKILSTPSHSKDSISLILDDGTSFVGDLEPIDYLDAYEDNAGLKEDWEFVMSYKTKVIFLCTCK